MSERVTRVSPPGYAGWPSRNGESILIGRRDPGHGPVRYRFNSRCTGVEAGFTLISLSSSRISRCTNCSTIRVGANCAIVFKDLEKVELLVERWLPHVLMKPEPSFCLPHDSSY